MIDEVRFYSTMFEYLGAGATGLAAILQGLLPELKGKKY